jgi:hypothetical protein
MWSYGPSIPWAWGVERMKIDGKPILLFDLGPFVLSIEFNPNHVNWN